MSVETLLGNCYTTAEIAELSGLSFRQVDHYDRGLNLLHPSRRCARGSGTRRLYSEDDLARARLIGALMALGARSPVVARVLGELPDDPAEWPPFVFVAPDGKVGANRPSGPACWMVGTQRLLERKVSTPAA